MIGADLSVAFGQLGTAMSAPHFALTLSGLSSNPTHGQVAEIGVTLTATASSFSEGAPSTIAYQWRDGSGDIAGATLATFLPSAAEDLETIHCVVTPDGYGSQSSAGYVVRHPYPTLSSALVDQSFASGTGVHTYDAAPHFSGTDLAFSLVSSIAGVSISSAGLVSVDTGATGDLTGITVSVQAANSGGEATGAFLLSVSTGVVGGPVILATDPSDDDTDHPLGDPIQITFDEPVRFTGSGNILLRENNGGWATAETFDATGVPPAATGPLSVSVGAVGTSGSFRAGDEVITWDFTGGGWTEYSGQTYTSPITESNYGGDGAQKRIFRNCTFRDINGDGFKFGKGVEDIWVINCTFLNVNNGSAVAGRSSSGSNRVHIVGCTVDGVDEDGISVSDVTGGPDHENCVVVGNDVQNTGRDGPNGLLHSIYVQAPDIKVIGNHVHGSRDDAAISCRSSAIITDNLIEGPAMWQGGRGIRYYADHPAGPSDTWSVKRNHVQDSNDPIFISNPPGQYQGNSSHLVNNFVVQNNTCDRSNILVEGSFWSGYSGYNLTASNNLETTGTEVGRASGQVFVDGDLLTITPSSDLIAGREYAVRIDASAIEGLSGDAFAGIVNDTTLSFNSPGGGGDTVAPVLSAASNAADGQTAMTGDVSTDEAGGVLYAVVTTSSVAPSPAQVKAGQDNSGGTASASLSQAVATAGMQAVAASGLDASTSYRAHFMHEDAAGNQSSVLSAPVGFTTDPAGLGLDGTHDYFIDAALGSDANTGTSGAPWASLSQITEALLVSNQTVRIKVKAGTYGSAGDFIRMNNSSATNATIEVAFEPGSVIDGAAYAGNESAMDPQGAAFTFRVYGNGTTIQNVTTTTGNALGGTGDVICYYHNFDVDNCVDGMTLHDSAVGHFHDITVVNCAKSGIAHVNSATAFHYRCHVTEKVGGGSGNVVVCDGGAMEFDDCILVPDANGGTVDVDNATLTRCQVGSLTTAAKIVATVGASNFLKCFVNAYVDGNGLASFDRCFGLFSTRCRNGGNIDVSRCSFSGPASSQNRTLFSNYNPGSNSQLVLKDTIFSTSYTFSQVDTTNAGYLVAAASEFHNNFLTDGKIYDADIVAADTGGTVIQGTQTGDPLVGSSDTLLMADYAFGSGSPAIGAGSGGGDIGFGAGEVEERQPQVTY